MKKLIITIKNTIIDLLDMVKSINPPNNHSRRKTAVQNPQLTPAQQMAQIRQAQMYQKNCMRQNARQCLSSIQMELFDVFSKGNYGVVNAPTLPTHIRPQGIVEHGNNRFGCAFSMTAAYSSVTAADLQQMVADMDIDIDQFLMDMIWQYGQQIVQNQYPFLYEGMRVRFAKSRGRMIYIDLY